jgi:hypothetical protein
MALAKLDDASQPGSSLFRLPATVTVRRHGLHAGAVQAGSETMSVIAFKQEESMLQVL